MRDTRLDTRDGMLAKIRAAVDLISARRDVQRRLDVINADPPAACDSGIVAAVREVCAGLNLPAKVMISRAYYDSLFMAQVCPTSMIFISSRGGVSHRPDEFSSSEQTANGVTVLAHTLARLAG